MEGVVDLDGLLGPEHRLLAGEGPFRAHPHLDEHFGHGVAGVEVVVHHQPLEAGQLADDLGGKGDVLGGVLRLIEADTVEPIIFLKILLTAPRLNAIILL